MKKMLGNTNTAGQVFVVTYDDAHMAQEVQGTMSILQCVATSGNSNTREGGCIFYLETIFYLEIAFPLNVTKLKIN